MQPSDYSINTLQAEINRLKQREAELIIKYQVMEQTLKQNQEFEEKLFHSQVQVQQLNQTLNELEIRVNEHTAKLAWANIELEKALADKTGRQLALENSEERLQTVIRNAPVILYTLDPNGIFTLSEGKELGVLGLQPGEVVGKSVFEVFRHNSLVQEEVKRALAGETFNSVMEEGGAVFESYYSPIKNEKGEITSVIGVSTNITAKRQVEKALKAERDFAIQIMRNMGQGLAVLKPDFTIEFANPAFAKMVGYTIEELVGKTTFDFISTGFDPEVGKVHWESLCAEGCSHVSELLRKDGTLFYAQIASQPIYREGKPTGIVAVISDLTGQKRVEQQLRLALEKEKELGEMKNRLIYTASHEFRTPLSAIISSTELLQHYALRWSEEKKHEILNRIILSANKLTVLIEDILVYNRAEESKEEFISSRLNLVNRCQDLVNNFQSSATESKTIRLVVIGEKQEAYLNEKILICILNNLLSNAIKYSRPGGQITLEVEWQSNEVIFRVKDEGIGIPLKDQANLFEPFHRASNVGTIPGTGFGLAIVKQSVLAHKGQIQFESKEGQGTTFTVSLPLNK